MVANDCLDAREFMATIPLCLPELDRLEQEDCMSVRTPHMHVRGLVLAGVEQEAAWTAPQQLGHADLANGSTGSHHGLPRFTAAHLGNPAVTDA